MKIVGFGDSFVYGSELKQPKHSWVAQCAEQLGYDYDTTAVPGCGNENISRQILSYFTNNTKQDTLAVINWTWGARWDFYIHTVERWTTLGLTCVPINLEREGVEPKQAEKILDFYNEYPGKSTLWDKFRTLQTIYATQQYLKLNGIKNIQTYMDYEMWDSQWHCPDYIETLQDLTKIDLQTFEGKNFLDWSYANGFEVTEQGLHPLEDAHEAASKLWLNTYQGVLHND